MAQLFQSEALGNEWILDAQLGDLLAVLHILAVQPLAACFKRGGDDERVVEMVFVARPNIESVCIKAGRVWKHPAERRQRIAQQALQFIGRERETRLGRNRVQAFLNNLIADNPAAFLDALRYQLLRNCCFLKRHAFQSVDNNVRVSRKYLALIQFVAGQFPSAVSIPECNKRA